MKLDIASIIKESRQELMGIGILSVLFFHLYLMGYLPTVINVFLKDATMFVYVEGFLFLSGFGLFYSYSSNSYYHYYRNRFKRLLIPYILLMSPYILITSIIDHNSFGLIIARVIGISFWFEGNYASMWFIHVLFILYIVYPLFHHFFFNRLVNRFFNFVWSLILFVIIYGGVLYGVSLFSPLFFSNCSFALYRIPFFFFGACVAHSINRNESFLWIVLWAISYLAISISNFSESLASVRNIYFATFLLPIVAITVKVLNSSHYNLARMLTRIFNWFGKYTLEIYILHLLIMNIMLRCGYDIRISIITGEFFAILLCYPIKKVTTFLL